MKMLFERVFALALATCLFVGCGSKSARTIDSDYELDATSFDAKHLKLVEKESGVVLPTDSRGQNFLWRGRQIDPEFLARIEISTNSVGALITQVGGLPNQTIHSSGLMSSVGWWQPSKGKIAVERTFLKSGDYVHIVIDQESGVWLLYVEWVSV